MGQDVELWNFQALGESKTARGDRVSSVGHGGLAKGLHRHSSLYLSARIVKRAKCPIPSRACLGARGNLRPRHNHHLFGGAMEQVSPGNGVTVEEEQVAQDKGSAKSFGSEPNNFRYFPLPRN